MEQLRLSLERSLELAQAAGGLALACVWLAGAMLCVGGLLVLLSLLPLVRARGLRHWSRLGIGLASLGVALGLFSYWLAQGEATVDANALPSVRELQAHRHALHARAGLEVSLAGAVLTLLASLLGLGAASRRQWEEDVQYEGGGGSVVWGVLVLTAAASAGSLLVKPIPGRDHSAEALQVLRVRDLLDAAKDDVCAQPDLKLPKGHEAWEMPELLDSRNRCLGHFLALLRETTPGGTGPQGLPWSAVESKVERVLAGGFLEPAREEILRERLLEKRAEHSAGGDPAVADARRALEAHGQRCAGMLRRGERLRGVKLELLVDISAEGQVEKVIRQRSAGPHRIFRCVEQQLQNAKVQPLPASQTVSLAFHLGGR